ncbi:hypothetical protein F2Q69_00013057 [Brassica cretica]|uniref:Uncharacterized protein n=1 Tax=Brassica cretica TaxID=69181 RepID=A0A8S9QS30_BRACR|nr:hypothetical protein F2Q69_00013057 [Brassica cretica]
MIRKRKVSGRESSGFSIDKPFEDAYYTNRLWMFFRETREKEEDIRRMFCEAREKMRMRITLKKKRASVSILPRATADHLGLQVEPSHELFTFVDCFQKNSGGIVRDLEPCLSSSTVRFQSLNRAEIDQLVEEIYRTMESAEERLDRRCDDIYFLMDLTMSSFTSQIEAIQREIVEIQRYIARRPEASTSIDRRNNKSTDSHRRTSIDEATNRRRLVPKV